MTPKWPWTLQSPRYSICVTNPNFSPFHSITSHFGEVQAILRQVHWMAQTSRGDVVLKHSLPYLVPCLWKQKKGKIHEYLKFHTSWTTSVETLPMGMHRFLGVNLLCTFQRCHLNFFLACGPMLTKMKTKIIKTTNFAKQTSKKKKTKKKEEEKWSI